MGLKQTKEVLTDNEIEELRKETGFSSTQITRLCNRFYKLSGGRDQLEPKDLLGMPEISANPLGERIVCAFFWSPPAEGDNLVEKTIDVKQFIRTLACFRPVKPEKTKSRHEVHIEEGESSVDSRFPPNSRRAKLQFLFRMYDLDNDNGISRLELIKILSMMIGSNITDEQLTSIADRTMAEADKDLNDAIDFKEFESIMDKVDIEQRMSIRFLS